MSKTLKNSLIITFNVIIFFFISIIHHSELPSIEIYGAKTTLIIPLLVAFSLWYSPITSAVTGMLSGMILDSATNGAYCFHAIVFLIIGTFVSVTSSTLFNKNLPSAIVISLICSAFYHIAKWLVFHTFFEGATNALTFLFEITLPSAVLTALFIFPFYYLYKYINKIKP